MSKELIRLVDCTMAFDDEVVLDNITLNIHDKEFLTLLGPSGCGKTTTLRIIGGFQTPTAGDVFFDGVRINAVPAHKRAINTVFQRYALFPHLNVFENIAFGLRIPKAKEERDEKGKVIRRQKVKLTEKEIQERVMEMLDVVNLKGFEKRSVSSLSGGQQQRVAIARALVNRPKVQLLDEPLGALAMRLRKDMQNELTRIQQAMGITFIYVTHDQEEALSTSLFFSLDHLSCQNVVLFEDHRKVFLTDRIVLGRRRYNRLNRDLLEAEVCQMENISCKVCVVMREGSAHIVFILMTKLSEFLEFRHDQIVASGTFAERTHVIVNFFSSVDT